MSTVTAQMEIIDLSKAEHTLVRGRHVWKLQAMLNVFLRSADTPAGEEPLPLLDTDGIGGALTKAEVLRFQAAHQLTEDAIVGSLTWRELFEFDVLLGG
jgi:peptidoglycan hydrolase-like protein with peptidoglycan-binding domain